MFLGGELDSKEDTTWPLSLFLVSVSSSARTAGKRTERAAWAACRGEKEGIGGRVQTQIIELS